MEKIFTAIARARDYLFFNPQCAFAASLIILIISFTVFALLLRKGIADKKSLKYFFISSAALTLFQTACSVPEKNDFVLPTALFVIVCALFAALGLIKAKKTESESDKQAENEEDDLPLFSEVKTPSVIPEAIKRFAEENSSVQKRETADKDVDFSHVKSVVDKLERFNLSAADKRAINALKINVMTAESCGMNNKLKSDINDGLCSVLKMMSKYNV